MKLGNLLNECVKVISLCHNDIVSENFVKDINERMYLIDWEYSGLNDPMWDLVAHSIECAFSESDEELFLNLYFNNLIEEKHKIDIVVLFLLWHEIRYCFSRHYSIYNSFYRYVKGYNFSSLCKYIFT
ncbi:phosphotransferase family protein [Clostridium perfringens]